MSEESQYGPNEVDQRDASTRPSIVTTRMHYDLVRKVGNLEQRINSSERVVHEISESNYQLREQFTKWLNDVLHDFNTITGAVGGLREGHHKLVHAIYFVAMLIGLGVVILMLK